MSEASFDTGELAFPELAVARILTAYCAALDENRFSDWIDMFEEAADYSIVTRENAQAGLPLAIMRCRGRLAMQDRVKAVDDLMLFAPRSLRHFVSNVRAERVADELHFTANVMVMRSMLDRTTEPFIVGTYEGRLSLTGERDPARRLAALRCIVDTSLIDNSLTQPL